MATSPASPVLILGAGINGCAFARELAVNGVSVVVVDTADVGSGATSGSSRLIHGGLRYLEYGEFDLVRESLAERARLLRLAPEFVRRLELAIPVQRRAGGLLSAAARFVGWERLARRLSSQSRGLWLVRAGLGFYDRYAGDADWPRHRVERTDARSSVLSKAPDAEIDSRRFPWLCTYCDAQIEYPERFLLALLSDGREAAAKHGSTFDVLTYHQATRQGRAVSVRPIDGDGDTRECVPAAIVNATGAWVDRALRSLDIESPQMMGPTKGSHLVTFQPALREALDNRGIYTEAADGRPVFILPLGPDATLVGTTDIPYLDDPGHAVAGDDELNYLVAAINDVFPRLGLSRDDIDFHYAGVRPLPKIDASTAAGITRRHWLHEHTGAEIPTYSVIGGKLTTCRSLAESTADSILARLGMPRIATTQERSIPAGQCDLPLASVSFEPGDRPCLDATRIPLATARWSIEHEYVRKLDDLVERRLMLLYQRRLTRQCLTQLASLLVETGRLPQGKSADEVARTVTRLRERFGKRVAAD